jgi:hypothetical protein
VIQGGEKLFKSQVVIDQIQLLKFEESDSNSYEKDIDLDSSPIKVVKTVYIDNDMDNRYDKMIRLSYDKKFGKDVTFDTIADGLVFQDDQGRAVMVRDYGFYIMNPGQDNEVIIIVDHSSETY